MISQLRGTLVASTLSSAVVDVQGIGFELAVSGETAQALPPVGGEALLYVRMIVRDDAVSLAGFSSREERALFDRLVAVSGVGPRLALAVLSKYTPSELYTVVSTEDVSRMSAVPGVGKKTAQRLILELKGVFAKDAELSRLRPLMPDQLAPAAPAADALADAQEALLSMGFTPREAELALEGYDGTAKVEDVLSAALRKLGMSS